MENDNLKQGQVSGQGAGQTSAQARPLVSPPPVTPPQPEPQARPLVSPAPVAPEQPAPVARPLVPGEQSMQQPGQVLQNATQPGQDALGAAVNAASAGQGAANIPGDVALRGASPSLTTSPESSQPPAAEQPAGVTVETVPQGVSSSPTVEQPSDIVPETALRGASPSLTVSTVNPKTASKKKRWIIVGVAAGGVLLVALAVILIVALSSGSGAEQNEEVYETDVTVDEETDSEEETEAAITCGGVTYEKQQGYEYKCQGTTLYVANEAQTWMTARSYVKAALETVADNFDQLTAAIESEGMKVSNAKVQEVMGEKMVTFLVTRDGQTEYAALSRMGTEMTAMTEVGVSTGMATLDDLETALKLLSSAAVGEGATKKIIESDVTKLDVYGWEFGNNE